MVAPIELVEEEDKKLPIGPVSPTSLSGQTANPKTPLAMQISGGRSHRVPSAGQSERSQQTSSTTNLEVDSSITEVGGHRAAKRTILMKQSQKAMMSFSLSPSEELLEQKILSAQFCRLASMPSNVFQAQVDSLAATMGQVSTDSLSFTTAPIRAMVLRARWQVQAVACSLFFLAFSLASFIVLDHRHAAYPLYRFTALQRRY